jgi:hypothetical protein
VTAKAVSAFAELAIVVGTETLTVAADVDGFGDDAGGFDEDWATDTGEVTAGALEGAVVETGTLLDGAALGASLETTDAMLVAGVGVDELDMQLETSSVAPRIAANTPYRRILDTPCGGPPDEDLIIPPPLSTPFMWTEADRTVTYPARPHPYRICPSRVYR